VHGPTDEDLPSSLSLAQFTTSKMAEPFGVVAGAICIVSAVTACVDCFEYIQFGRQFGRDFQTDQLALSRARLRLTRRGESVDIYNDLKSSKSNATATEIQVAKDTLLRILGYKIFRPLSTSIRACRACSHSAATCTMVLWAGPSGLDIEKVLL
jgi:hypothetical protein